MNTFGGLKIFVNEHAVTVRKVKKLRFRKEVWRGLPEMKSYIVEHEIRTPAVYKFGGTMVVHPVIYGQIKSQFDRNANQIDKGFRFD